MKKNLHIHDHMNYFTNVQVRCSDVELERISSKGVLNFLPIQPCYLLNPLGGAVLPSVHILCSFSVGVFVLPYFISFGHVFS